MDRTGWADTVPRVRPWQTTKRSADGLWKRRELEKSKTRLSHLAWKSRKRRWIPTFPQPRLLLVIYLKPDKSRAKKTGHFNLLTTQEVKFCVSRGFDMTRLKKSYVRSTRACGQVTANRNRTYAVALSGA